jgi:hypothetical protein
MAIILLCCSQSGVTQLSNIDSVDRYGPSEPAAPLEPLTRYEAPIPAWHTRSHGKTCHGIRGLASSEKMCRTEEKAIRKD